MAATVGDALVLEVCTLITSWALSILPSLDRPWSETDTTWSSLAILFWSLVMDCRSLELSFDLPSTTRVPVASFVGWNGAARFIACTLGELGGRNELLSVLTALPSEGNKAMHKAPATSQKAMMAYRNRIANRASPAMKFPTAPPRRVPTRYGDSTQTGNGLNVRRWPGLGQLSVGSRFRETELMHQRWSVGTS